MARQMHFSLSTYRNQLPRTMRCWHESAPSLGVADVDYLLGRPKMARLGTGLRKPGNDGLGLDVAGEVEAVGANDPRFQPGDDVFGDMTQHGLGAFAEYDWILDIAPFHSILASRRALRPHGVYVIVPATMVQVFRALVLAPLLSVGGKRKMGIMAWKTFKLEDVDTLKELVAAGKITPVIDREYPLTEVSEALRYQAEGTPRGKIVINV